MDLFSYLVLIVITILSLVYLFFQHSYSYWKKRGVPHRKPQFPQGNIQGMRTKRHLTSVFDDLYNEFKGTGKYIGFYAMHRPSLIITDPDLIKRILINDFNVFNWRGFYHNKVDDPISFHLFTSHGQEWKPLRKKFTPTFTSGKMKYMFSTIVDVANRFKQTFKAAIETNNEVEIKEFCARFTTDVIGSCVFGIECNSLKDPETEFRKRGREIFEKPRNGPISGIFIQNFQHLARLLHRKVYSDSVSQFFSDVVVNTLQYREKSNIERHDFMDILIKLQKEDNTLTVDEITAQVFLFFTAGYESSASTMNYCLFELAKAPEIQDKVRRNVRKVLTKYNDKITYEATSEMNILEQAIHGKLKT